MSQFFTLQMMSEKRKLRVSFRFSFKFVKTLQDMYVTPLIFILSLFVDDLHVLAEVCGERSIRSYSTAMAGLNCFEIVTKPERRP